MFNEITYESKWYHSLGTRLSLSLSRWIESFAGATCGEWSANKRTKENEIIDAMNGNKKNVFSANALMVRCSGQVSVR